MNESSPIAMLSQEHEAALEKIRTIELSLRGFAAGPTSGELETARNLWASFDEFRRLLLTHFRKEEEGLFPDVRQMVSEGAPRVDILSAFFAEESDDDLKAHTLLRARLKELAVLMQRAKAAEVLDEALASSMQMSVNLTQDLLARHADKETRLVFPMIARLLSPRHMAAILNRIGAVSSAADVSSPSNEKR